MGGFYGSVQIKTEDRDRTLEVVNALAEQFSIRCFVGPVISGWVGVYPSNNGQDERVGAAIAERLGSTVWHVMVHDDDILAYTLWQDGELVDSFYSRPGYFGDENLAEEAKMTGNPELLSRLVGGDVDTLRGLLSQDGGFTFEYERLEQLARAVGLANLVTAYEYLKDGENRDIKGWRKFKEFPKSALDKRKREAQAKKQAIAAFKKQKLLLRHEVERKEHVLARPCLIDGGFLVFRSGIGDNPVRTTRYLAPGVEPDDLPWNVRGQVNDVASDAAGQRVALALGKCVEVWDAASAKKLREIPEDDWAFATAISSDGRRAAKVSRKAVMIFDIDDDRLLMNAPRDTQYHVTLHPTGEWIVCANPTLEFAKVEGTHNWRRLSLTRSAVPGEEEERRNQKLPDLETLVQLFRERAEEMVYSRWQRRIPTDDERRTADEQLERVIDQTRFQLEDMRKADGLWSHETVACTGFSRDGGWFWCGTNRALWVFRWSDIANGDDPIRPTWWYPTTQFDVQYRSVQQEYVYDIAETISESAIVFGTLTGRLYRMELETGEVQEILQWPHDTPIRILLTPDASLLGCTCTTGLRSRDLDRRNASSWQIWDLRKLQDATSTAPQS